MCHVSILQNVGIFQIKPASFKQRCMCTLENVLLKKNLDAELAYHKYSSSLSKSSTQNRTKL